MSTSEIYVVILGVYDEATPVAVAATEVRAKELLIEAGGDPDDRFSGCVMGPFQVGQLTRCADHDLVDCFHGCMHVQL